MLNPEYRSTTDSCWIKYWTFFFMSNILAIKWLFFFRQTNQEKVSLFTPKGTNKHPMSRVQQLYSTSTHYFSVSRTGTDMYLRLQTMIRWNLVSRNICTRVLLEQEVHPRWPWKTPAGPQHGWDRLRLIPSAASAALQSSEGRILKPALLPVIENKSYYAMLLHKRKFTGQLAKICSYRINYLLGELLAEVIHLQWRDMI